MLTKKEMKEIRKELEDDIKRLDTNEPCRIHSNGLGCLATIEDGSILIDLSNIDPSKIKGHSLKMGKCFTYSLYFILKNYFVDL